MAIYHFDAKRISRGKGQSATGFSAYRSASCIHDERTGITFDYSKKTGVVYSEIIAPENSPEWVYDREKLWNEVERVEKRNDAYLAKEFEFALPKELDLETQKELAKEFLKDTFVKEKGIVVDYSIHDKRDGNPHVHAMITLRTIEDDKFSKTKRRDLDNECRLNKKDSKAFASNVDVLVQWREKWADYTNKYLERENVKERIDHRSYKEQGIDKVPTKHMGVKAHHLEQKGIKTEIGELNRQIKLFNKEKIVELEKYRELKKELEQAKKKLTYKKFKFKYNDDVIRFRIIQQYKKEFPEIKYVRKTESKAIFNLNSQIGKKATVKAIYDMYNALLKSVELDRKLAQEIEKVLEAKTLNNTIQDKQSKKEELSKGVLGRMKNKADIERLTSEIERLDYKLQGMGVDTNKLDPKINELNEAKIKNQSNVELFRKTTEAKKAIDETQRRAIDKQRRKNYYKYRQKQKENERGYSR